MNNVVEFLCLPYTSGHTYLVAILQYRIASEKPILLLGCAGPVWQRHLDITPIFHENFLSLWDADCDDLFSTCQFPTVWRGWLKEQLKWSKRCFSCHLLNRLFCRLNILTEKKQRREALLKRGGEIETGEGEKGSLLTVQALIPVEKIVQFTILLWISPAPNTPWQQRYCWENANDCRGAGALRPVWISEVSCEVENEKRTPLGPLLTSCRLLCLAWQ